MAFKKVNFDDLAVGDVFNSYHTCRGLLGESASFYSRVKTNDGAEFASGGHMASPETAAHWDGRDVYVEIRKERIMAKMREIKFRCWDGEFMNTVSSLEWTQAGISWYGPGVGSGWCYLDPAFDWSQKNCNPKPEHIDVLMQYTGLKDKNVWVSDIITFEPKDHSTKIPQIAVVEYCEKRACFIAHSSAWLIPLHECRNIEIIGNIHENPKLMEAK